MGGKNHADNSAVVQQQQEEAAAEAAKEAARQARIDKGLASIKSAFEGSPVMASKSTPYDWSKFSPAVNPTGSTADTLYSGAPEGYTVVKVAKPQTASASKTPALYGTVDNPNAGGGYGRGPIPQPTTSSGGGASSATQYDYALKDASGKVYNRGDPLSLTTQTDTGERSGGFGDAFYNKYKQAVLDYYMPQVDKQYSDAKKQATYGLARSGNLRSSAANTLTADLSTQNDVNVAGVRNQADTAAGDLRSKVNTEQQKAVSQLYATEDPEVAANQSLAAVRDISLSQPQMSPLSALFNVATIGGANIMKGYQNQQNLNAFTSGLPKDRSRNVGTA